MATSCVFGKISTFRTANRLISGKHVVQIHADRTKIHMNKTGKLFANGKVAPGLRLPLKVSDWTIWSFPWLLTCQMNESAVVERKRAKEVQRARMHALISLTYLIAFVCSEGAFLLFYFLFSSARETCVLDPHLAHLLDRLNRTRLHLIRPREKSFRNVECSRISDPVVKIWKHRTAKQMSTSEMRWNWPKLWTNC